MTDIPACLIIPQAERNAAWKGRRLTDPRREDKAKKHPWHLPTSMSPVAWKMVREAEAAKEARKKERLAMLHALAKK